MASYLQVLQACIIASMAAAFDLYPIAPSSILSLAAQAICSDIIMAFASVSSESTSTASLLEKYAGWLTVLFLLPPSTWNNFYAVRKHRLFLTRGFQLLGGLSANPWSFKVMKWELTLALWRLRADSHITQNGELNSQELLIRFFPTT